MRREISVIIFAFAAVLVCATATRINLFAAASDPDIPTVAVGTEFPVEVRHTINATEARPGDAVRFRTLQPILIGSQVVVPAGSTLLGRVIEAHAASESEDSLLRFSIHMIEWRNKSYIMVNAVVTGRIRAKMHVRGDVRHVMPNFLERVRIRYEPSAAATTMLTSRENVVLRGGTLLVLRHLAPPIDATVQQPHMGQ